MLPIFPDRRAQSASTAATPAAQTEESNPLPLGEGGATDPSLARRVRVPGFDQTCDPHPLLRLRAVALALRAWQSRAGLSQRERRKAPPRPPSEERRARAPTEHRKRRRSQRLP